ncbi:MAG: hypothetical protein KDK08_19030, partial [Rhizobiaceae bacterium]|nr:hypothetical protein [Rhizobiaceae bacterium]
MQTLNAYCIDLRIKNILRDSYTRDTKIKPPHSRIRKKLNQFLPRVFCSPHPNPASPTAIAKNSQFTHAGFS